MLFVVQCAGCEFQGSHQHWIAVQWCNACLHTASLCYVFILPFQSALQELEELKQIVPKESLVYFLIGKVGEASLSLEVLCFPSWQKLLDEKTWCLLPSCLHLGQRSENSHSLQWSLLHVISQHACFQPQKTGATSGYFYYPPRGDNPNSCCLFYICRLERIRFRKQGMDLCWDLTLRRGAAAGFLGRSAHQSSVLLIWAFIQVGPHSNLLMLHQKCCINVCVNVFDSPISSLSVCFSWWPSQAHRGDVLPWQFGKWEALMRL